MTTPARVSSGKRVVDGRLQRLEVPEPAPEAVANNAEATETAEAVESAEATEPKAEPKTDPTEGGAGVGGVGGVDFGGVGGVGVGGVPEAKSARAQARVEVKPCSS